MERGIERWNSVASSSDPLSYMVAGSRRANRIGENVTGCTWCSVLRRKRNHRSKSPVTGKDSSLKRSRRKRSCYSGRFFVVRPFEADGGNDFIRSLAARNSGGTVPRAQLGVGWLIHWGPLSESFQNNGVGSHRINQNFGKSGAGWRDVPSCRVCKICNNESYRLMRHDEARRDTCASIDRSADEFTLAEVSPL